MPDFDVLIIGAGLAGVGMACRLEEAGANLRYAILERRDRIGGTWDFFRYPGIRSDSDMYTLSYPFRPWLNSKVLAEGPAIRDYIEETAQAYDVTRNIEFGIKVESANFSTADNSWTVTARREVDGAEVGLTARFLVMCTGYYDYDQGYLPDLPGREQFQGILIHPQHWPEGLDCAGKAVVVIGSGATAVTLVPALAKTARHVTMLQRSPSYIFSIPAEDKMARALGRVLPKNWVSRMARSRNLLLQRTIYKASQRFPKQMRRLLLSAVRKQVGPGVDQSHFQPTYNPWDERLCAVPDGDLFKTLRSGDASIVTDAIEHFTAEGILLKSGRHLDADIVVSATGLRLKMLGGISIRVDGAAQMLNEGVTYKGVMAAGIPNLAFVFGYTNIPWTVRADLSALWIVRLLTHMRSNSLTQAVAYAPAEVVETASIMDSMQSGYVKRGESELPRQGRGGPWQVTNDLNIDKPLLLRQPVDDGILQFS
ncbi:NAD(P)/FAD-dependent oxidoreductase [Sphingomonas sp. PL-96]|uniref:flavin-containing monooxygenase n=1 Tax=Sphingomonas sp. PL-96 TaxID=2887201 RepID=UPI001E46D5A5|nr:NAD(P)/FAD-dependent oxidoreductase [Sphingomonas sp. PL-96]MCC2978256.1 NAD(P)/FAD-dependent oxidoreductase [Sphingomonas sp. PL-96]